MAERNETGNRKLLFNRILKAPPELVYDVWTDPKHIVNWWGPTGFSLTVQEMNVKPGGTTRMVMHGPDGIDYPNKIIYREVLRPERLVYWQGSDSPEHPISFEVTILFKAVGEITELDISMVFKNKEELDYVIEKYGAVEGHKQHMARLEQYLSTILKK